MEIFTVGFTKKTAPEFFQLLREAGIRRLIDIRLNNVSQLAGFTKKYDLPFFLRELCNAEYCHEPLLAPDETILKAYKKRLLPWDQFASDFIRLLEERRIEEKLDQSLFQERTVLLCSEATHDYCHRRLVTEYLSKKWGDICITHL